MPWLPGGLTPKLRLHVAAGDEEQGSADEASRESKTLLPQPLLLGGFLSYLPIYMFSIFCLLLLLFLIFVCFFFFFFFSSSSFCSSSSSRRCLFPYFFRSSLIRVLFLCLIFHGFFVSELFPAQGFPRLQCSEGPEVRWAHPSRRATSPRSTEKEVKNTKKNKMETRECFFLVFEESSDIF